MRFLAAAVLLGLMAVGCGSGTEEASPKPEPEAPQQSASGAPGETSQAAPGSWPLDVSHGERFSSDGEVLLVTDELLENGFTVGVTYTSYSLADGAQLAGPTELDPPPPRCGTESVVRSDGTHVVLDTYTVETPAQGLEPASEEVFLRAVDAHTLDTLWTSPYEGGWCHGVDVLAGPRFAVESGSDGAQHVVLTTPVGVNQSSNGVIVDLDNGEMTHPDSGTERFLGAAGAWVLAELPGDTLGVVDPATLEVHGRIENYCCLDAIERHRYAVAGGLLVAPGADEAVMPLAAWSLPTAEPEWSGTEVGAGVAAVEPESGLVIRGSAARNEHGDALLYPSAASAVDPSTGSELWGPLGDEYCGVLNGEVLVEANDQLVGLDPATGEQLWYEPDRDRCPTVLPGLVIHYGGDAVVELP
ncbi:PQQ-binding-like beta-propeller repeat protein [Streptomyces aidingensis]|uniref:PQQ-binding-like beta-propeller repeat protein n=1 Tax=Streptomyces aidingensis TaxID=910347 RepID=UPI0015873077|nr:PQQ-binding-like beta-propeller repeat protein [Streptomyces aidingensis]